MQNSIVAGIASSIVTEILKFIPFLRSNDITIAIVNILVVAIATYATSGTITFTSFLTALAVSITTYLAAVKPVSVTAGFSSQK